MKVDFPAPLGPMREVMLPFLQIKGDLIQREDAAEMLAYAICFRGACQFLEKYSRVFLAMIAICSSQPARPPGMNMRMAMMTIPKNVGVHLGSHGGQDLAKIHMHRLAQPKDDQAPEERAPQCFPSPHYHHRGQLDEKRKAEHQRAQITNVETEETSHKARKDGGKDEDLKFTHRDVYTGASARHFAVA